MKRDEPAVEQVVDAWGEEQAVLTVQSFLVGAVSPRLAVTCAKVFQPADPSHATLRLERANALFEETLATPGQDKGFTLGVRERGIASDLIPQVLFPHREPFSGRFSWGSLVDLFGPRQSLDIGSDQVCESPREVLVELGQIYRLDTAAVGE